MPSQARLSMSAQWSVMAHMFAAARDAQNMNVLIEGLLLAAMGLDILATRNPDSCICLFFISDGNARSASSRRRRGMFEKNGGRPPPGAVLPRLHFLHERQDSRELGAPQLYDVLGHGAALPVLVLGERPFDSRRHFGVH